MASLPHPLRVVLAGAGLLVVTSLGEAARIVADVLDRFVRRCDAAAYRLSFWSRRGRRARP